MTIIIDNKEYPIKWGYGAIVRYCDMMDCGLEGLDYLDDSNKDILQKNKAIVTLLLAALQLGCTLDFEKFGKGTGQLDISFDVLEDWIHGEPEGTLANILGDFRKTQIFGRSLNPDPAATVEETTKKKSRSIK